MTETFPDIAPECRLVSVVMCSKGYQSVIEERVPVNLHPHFVTLAHVAKGATPCDSIRAALQLSGKRKSNAGNR
jgi:hypothetical protein